MLYFLHRRESSSSFIVRVTLLVFLLTCVLLQLLWPWQAPLVLLQMIVSPLSKLLKLNVALTRAPSQARYLVLNIFPPRGPP
jgi:hypothetical protein